MQNILKIVIFVLLCNYILRLTWPWRTERRANPIGYFPNLHQILSHMVIQGNYRYCMYLFVFVHSCCRSFAYWKNKAFPGHIRDAAADLSPSCYRLYRVYQDAEEILCAGLRLPLIRRYT